MSFRRDNRADTLPPRHVPIPNADRATITVEKLTAYLLNPSHKRGGAKARLLLSLGYRTDAPQVLESDLRAQHLSLPATRTSQSAYGVAYEIETNYHAQRQKRAFLLNLAD
jgi:uncharacterized protein DUF6883